MFSWLKKLLGVGYTPAETEPTSVVVMPTAPASAAAVTSPVTKTEKTEKPKKAATAKSKVEAKKDDGLDAMNKRDLLVLAKERGVKSNASMNKDAIIKALRNA